MDAIKQYLDYMFRDFPPTPEVAQARADLLDMMGDKYAQLRADGVPEHHAVAQVISDFGDIDELAETLGIQPHSADEGAVIHVDSPLATQFMEHRRVRALSIAVGVMLTIFAGAALITLTMLGDQEVGILSEGASLILGFGAGLVFVAISLFFFLNHPYGNEYERFSKTRLSLDYDAKQAVLRERDNYASSIRLQTTLGIGMFLLAFFMIIVASVVGDGRLGELGFTVFFSFSMLITAVGVGLVVHAQSINNSFKILLQEANFAKEKKVSDPIFDGFAGVYWLATLLLFMALGFAKNWENSDIIWVIWPIAAILFAIIAVTWDTIRTAKKRGHRVA